MPGLDFNGTGANTSKVQATGQAALAAGPFTIVACVLPDSSGQGSAGLIFGTATAANAQRAQFQWVLNGANLALRLNVPRATTATDFIANNRFVLPSASTSVPAIVAATFDDAASPKAHLYTTANSTINDAELAECTYLTTTAGTGAISGSDTTWAIGQKPLGGQVYDGAILWVVVVPKVLTVNELQQIASGIFPPFISDLADGGTHRIPVLGVADGGVLDLAAPATTWTATAVTATDVPAQWFDGDFAPGSGPIVQLPLEEKSGTAATSAASATSATGRKGAAATGAAAATSATSASGKKNAFSSGTAAATSATTAAGKKNASGTGSASATAAATATGNSQHSSTAATSATSATAESGTTQRFGAATAGSLSATSGTAAHGTSADIVIVATSTTTATGTTGRSSNATVITHTSTTSATGTEGSAGTATVNATSTVTAAGFAELAGGFGPPRNGPLLRASDPAFVVKKGQAFTRVRSQVTAAGSRAHAQVGVAHIELVAAIAVSGSAGKSGKARMVTDARGELSDIEDLLLIGTL